MEAARFGVIDIGSYELVLKIFEFVSGKKVRVTDDVRYVLELGRETYTRHSLCFETIEKLCKVLLGFRKILEEYHVTECDVVATSGLREADNARLILDRIYVDPEHLPEKTSVISASCDGYACLSGICVVPVLYLVVFVLLQSVVAVCSDDLGLYLGTCVVEGVFLDLYPAL